MEQPQPASTGVKTELTWDSWNPYRDRYGLIHTKKPDDPNRDPKTNNGLLYTAEACTIMQALGVPFPRDVILNAYHACQREPGLYNHSPTNHTDQGSIDDYIGIGAIAGICKFSELAKEILDYGESIIPAPVLDGGIFKHATGWLALLKNGLGALKPGHLVPYNYNNVNPGQFTAQSWFGKSPGVVVHWKIAARRQPTPTEMALWAGTLLYSGIQNELPPAFHDSAERDHFLQSWLMVLTYRTSGYRATVADAAVALWWDRLRKKWPGGIREVMREYVSVDQDENPLCIFIDDFEGIKGEPEVIITGGPDAGFLEPLQRLFSDLMPGNFLDGFEKALDMAQSAVAAAQEVVSTQRKVLEAKNAAVEKANGLVDSINKKSVALSTQVSSADQRLHEELRRKAGSGPVIVIKAGGCGVRKVGFPFPHLEPYCWPPIVVPNPAWGPLVKLVDALSKESGELHAKAATLAGEKESAVRNQATALAERAEALTQLAGPETLLKEAQDKLTKAQERLVEAQLIIHYLIPGVPIPFTH
ncbi:MAG: hypothetical protein ACJ74Y_16200 [Bryobacteraceae bacterium]